MISIKGMDKAEVLAKLYNQAKSSGLDLLRAPSSKPMTVAEAQLHIDSNKRMRFDYLKGRALKVDLSEDEFDERAYDRDNGTDMAREAIAKPLS